MAHNAATTEPAIQNAITKIRVTKNSALKNSIGASTVRTSSRLSGLEKLDVRFERVSREARYSEAPHYRHRWACVDHHYSSAFLTTINPFHHCLLQFLLVIGKQSMNLSVPFNDSAKKYVLHNEPLGFLFRASVCRSICMDACRNMENVKVRNDCVKFGKATTTYGDLPLAAFRIGMFRSADISE